MIHAYVFDPAKDKPTLLFRNSKTKRGLCGVDGSWDKVKPLFDFKSPEFQGEIIAPIWRDGKLWILKWDSRSPEALTTHDPNTLRLVCADPARGSAVVVPLRYDVPEAIRRIKVGEVDMSHPFIDQQSVLATPDYLFFAAGRVMTVFPIQSPSPVLCYIRWDQIIAWIKQNHPNFQ